MLTDPARGQRLVARTAAAHLNRPERERGSVLQFPGQLGCRPSPQ
jgi:hypothetical protein